MNQNNNILSIALICLMLISCGGGGGGSGASGSQAGIVGASTSTNNGGAGGSGATGTASTSGAAGVVVVFQLAIKWRAGNRITGTSTERGAMDTNIEDGVTFEESNTGKHYIILSGSWHEIL